MFQSLADGNDSNSVTALGVSERHDDPHEKAKGNIAQFAIVFARVLDRNQRTVKDDLGIVKIDAVFGEIERSLLFIPREHDRSVATLCGYVKIGPGGVFVQANDQANRRAAPTLAKLKTRTVPSG